MLQNNQTAYSVQTSMIDEKGACQVGFIASALTSLHDLAYGHVD